MGIKNLNSNEEILKLKNKLLTLATEYNSKNTKNNEFNDLFIKKFANKRIDSSHNNIFVKRINEILGNNDKVEKKIIWKKKNINK